MPLVDGNEQWLPGEQRAGAGPDERGRGHGDCPTDDGAEEVLVRHVLIVGTQPVKDLCAAQEYVRDLARGIVALALLTMGGSGYNHWLPSVKGNAARSSDRDRKDRPMSASLQLSAVPRSHLSEERLAALRGLLVSERATQAHLRAQHESFIAQVRGLTDADSVLERELAEAGAARAEETVAAVDHALERLEDGTYGWCERCGTPMPFERLEAIPSARVCVACLARRAGWPR
jgi:RNA polymerase-binding transcription factor DksA